MTSYEWDYEYDNEEDYYVILHRDMIIIDGLTEEQAISISQKHNLIVGLLQNKH